MNNDTIKSLEKIIDTISIPELLIIQGTQLLLLSPHSKDFIETQKIVINKTNIRDVVKAICLQILNEVEVNNEVTNY